MRAIRQMDEKVLADKFSNNQSLFAEDCKLHLSEFYD